MTSRIGVFVCDCKGLVSDHIDTARLAEEAAALETVAFVDRLDMICSEKELGAAIKKLVDEDCDRMLFAGCSPRSSLKFPEERIAGTMQTLGLSPELFEVANIREQCAWQHRDKEAATLKATDLVCMAHARLLTDEPAPSPAPIARRALVVGGGPAGLQAAKDLDSAGIPVTIAERNPWLGGRLCQLQRVFQCEGWPSVCDSSCVGPVQAKGAILSPNIQTLTRAEVTNVARSNGSFRVTLSAEPEFVDQDLCISCDKCAEVCPEEVDRRFDMGMTKRKAIDKEFERALPDLYTVDSSACTKCGDCVPVCPTNAINLEAETRTKTEDFGAVFLATGTDPIDLSGYPQYVSSHPNVITSMEFERLMDQGLKRPSDGEEPEQIVFVQCAGSRMGPARKGEGAEYCSKTCCAVTTKQIDRLLVSNPMVEPIVVYYRDMRTYERALESIYQKLQISGIEFVNGEVASINPNDEGGLALSIDPIRKEDDEGEAKPIDLDADLVVLAAAQTPSHGSNELYKMFEVQTDRNGYPIENQPRLFRPTESLVNRVFTVGSSAGPKVIQQASEQGSAAAMRALPTLLRGEAEPLRYASRVNPERCTKCRTCETVCPHGAIRMTEDGAVSDPAFCQACGFCAAACPSHAAELVNFTDQQILAQVKVAFDKLPLGEPRILALLCYWCSYSAADFAGVARVDVPSNYRTIRIRCSSSVNTGLVMQMFKMGVDGILIAGCPAKSCHHLWGNFLADKRTDLARAFMGQMGLDPSRLRFEYIGAPMQAKLVDTIGKMDATLRKLGPNPASTLHFE
ncbi:MAG: hydrogenase iron-sulfur subunit [Deltaproteobacteria bacterium]|nr:hydrogenase iron-sulfur subunit [Deltaproteobacteria bacterium]